MKPAEARDPEAGVTLIEMLVAVALFGMIGLAGFSVLDAILRANGRAEEALDRVATLDRTFSVLRRDLLETDAGRLKLDADSLVLTGPRDVTYRASGGDLLRTVGDPPLDQLLVADISDVVFRALDGSSQWQAAWPPEGRPETPFAIEAVITTRRGDSVTRLFHALSASGTP